MQKQIKGVALILLGILAEVACIPAKSITGSSVEEFLWLLGFILGIYGIALVFHKPQK